MICFCFSKADRAKQIKTKATINEDPTEALIRELKEQNEKLKSMLASGQIQDKDETDQVTEGLSPDEIEALKKEWMAEIKANLENNQREMEDMGRDYQDRVREARRVSVAGENAQVSCKVINLHNICL